MANMSSDNHMAVEKLMSSEPLSSKQAPLKSSALERLLRDTRASGTGATALRYRRSAIALAVAWVLGCLAWGAPAALMALLLKPLAPQLAATLKDASPEDRRDVLGKERKGRTVAADVARRVIAAATA